MRSSGSHPIALTADTDGDCIALRLPSDPSDTLTWGTELRVGKRQQALVGPGNGSAITDLPTISFSPGHYCLTTASIGQLISYATQNAARRGPLRASITFVTTDPIADLQWKDRDPLYVADTVLGQIPIQVEATFGVLIKDTFLFSQKVMADQRQYSCQDLEAFCQDYLLRPALIHAVLQLSRPIHLLDTYGDELTALVISSIAFNARALGLDLSDLNIERLKIPTAVLNASRNVGQDLQVAKQAKKHGLYGVSSSLGLDMVVPKSVTGLLPKNLGMLPDGATARAADSSILDYLEHLAELRDRGVLTHPEFDQHKYHLIGIR